MNELEVYLEDDDTQEIDVLALFEDDTLPKIELPSDVFDAREMNGLVHIRSDIVRELARLLEQNSAPEYAAVRYLPGDCAEVTLDCPTLLYCPVTFTGVIHDGGHAHVMRDNWQEVPSKDEVRED